MEVGGLLPNDLLFDCLGAVNAINIERHYYRNLADGHAYSDQYESDDSKRSSSAMLNTLLLS